MRPCGRNYQPFLSVTLVHVQDEADIRLRTDDEREETLPKRGCASKVQMHVVELVVGEVHHKIPTELEALGDKTTSTLATSLEGTMRNTLRDVLPANDTGPEIWVSHLIIGDAIPTNDSAARVVWASVKECPLGQRRRYFLLIVKCMTHQTSLSAKCGVEGSAASTANGNDDVPGMATRLFKYLINDYYDGLCTNVSLVKGDAHELVQNRLRRLFGVMHKDPLLELGPATSNLLATVADLILRFNYLLRYPFILCRLCKMWFPTTYLDTMMVE